MPACSGKTAFCSKSRNDRELRTPVGIALQACRRLGLALLPSVVFLAGGSFSVHAAPPTTWSSTECASVNAPCTPSKGKKFYPGFYALFGLNNGTPVDASSIAGKTEYVGMVVAYRWRDIETSLGNYDFSRIDGDKAIAKSSGRKLGVYLRLGNNTAGGSPATPSYMWNNSSYGGVVSGAYGNYLGGSGNASWNPLFWNPNVKARVFALLDALAMRYDNDPDIAFVIFPEETSSGATTADDPNYTCGGEMQALKDIFSHAWAVLPKTPVLLELDYGCADIPSNFHQFIVNGGNGAWTIDARPTVAALDTNGYSLYRNYYDKIAGLVVLDGWTDVNAWPGYLTASQILAELGPGKTFQTRYFVVDQSGSSNQASINQAVSDWWVQHGQKWPFDQRPSGW